MASSFRHVPVLMEDTVRQFVRLSSRSTCRVLDCTVGGGGHSSAILSALPRASLLGIDCDMDAVRAAERALALFGGRARVMQARWPSGIDGALEAAGWSSTEACIDGILLDAGVSSHQIDTPERGFSFARDGPLDMRMNQQEAGAARSAAPSNSITAADLVNKAPEAALRGALSAFGEEPNAGAIARAIVAQRTRGGVHSTLELARVVSRALRRDGAGASTIAKKHPATKTFQALRIAVNAELDALDSAMKLLPTKIACHGILAVITFHSLESRLVKAHFAKLVDSGEWRSEGVFAPGPEEINRNNRARSAQLRVVQRVAVGASKP